MPTAAPRTALCLSDLHPGQSGVVDRLDLEADDARRLMELGFLPGARVLMSRRSPFGDPSVFRIDDSEVALRRETARQITLRAEP
ncbi:MAG: ferrous iron transport protein A [Bryobacterales bacterium]|nr:ferrous iron transport protein A [Bryobacterales bacterium]